MFALAQARGVEGGGEVIDDKFLKSILDVPKDLQLYADTARSASLAGGPIVEKLHIFEENSAIRQMMKDFDHCNMAMGSALGSIEELCCARAAYSDSLLFRAADEARQAIAGFESRFRLPEMTEIGRLMAEYKTCQISEAFSMHTEQAERLHQAMESMCTPWLDAHKEIPSIIGFAELQRIGYSLQNMPTFDEKLAASLRINLGDWRDPITWRPEIFTNLSARSEFYASLGFNPDLTDFPMPAFKQSLNLAGLIPEPSSIDDRYTNSIPTPSDEDELDEGLTRTNMAHDRLLRFESRLRAFIDEKMKLAFGSDWPKHRLPNGMFDQWQEKKRKAELADAREHPLLAYADFTDYVPVICREDNWRSVFAPFFKRKESVRESFQRLYPIRVDTMHARIITQDDELFLCVETLRLERIIIKNRN